MSGRCLVYVEGDATNRLSAGDTVSIIGGLSWPESPGNPGEFDYSQFLNRQQFSAQLFVKHPDAISVVTPASRFHVMHWVSMLRNDANRVLTESTDAEVHGVALALLLGERRQIPADTERHFVASGTMHLLAISGLHVGILFLFLLRLCNLLFLRRRQSLVFALGVCGIYAMVQDSVRQLFEQRFLSPYLSPVSLWDVASECRHCWV